MIVTIITLAVVLFDVLTKYLTVQLLVPLHADVVIIPHVISFSYVENRGAAFGLFAENRWVFMVTSLVLIFALLLILKYSNIKHPLFLISVSLILGGGIGNMIDRIFVGYVVDFIKITFMDFPVFNVADCGVVIGTVLLAVYLIFFDGFFAKKKTEGNEN